MYIYFKVLFSIKFKSKCKVIYKVSLVCSSGAGVLRQQQQSPVHCRAGVVGEIYRQTRNLWPKQASCSVTAGNGSTVRNSAQEKAD